MIQYFPKPFRSFGRNINVKVDLSNYGTKADLKNVTHADTSSFALKTNLANLKAKVDKLDIDKLVEVPLDLSKLNNVVKNEAIKKIVYDNVKKNISFKTWPIYFCQIFILAFELHSLLSRMLTTNFIL